ncbi:tail fiber repeat 2-containing protein [Yersinia enterocolitica]|uniref:tail fiber protein n=1 Tax=Yersinia enterocolitica TaxID=630 RepID=UPI0005E3AABB|nr:phage tail protein [Yersinia enterocolitica]CQR02217.1 tail fiber repeat 2-containing protein [Yersinia enterocolitica]
MHRIDTPTAQVDKFGAGKNGFTRGNPQTGVPATALDDDYFDAVQEELAGVVEAAGFVLNKADRAQLLAAIQHLITLGIPDLKDASLIQKGIVQLSSSTTSVSEILAATPKAVKDMGDNALKTTNNLSEIAAAGSVAQATTQANIGLTPSKFSGRLLNTQTFTSTGTYTPTAGTGYIIVEAVGGGGASGAISATSASQNAITSVGSPGAYAKVLYTSVPSTASVVIGSGGVGILGAGPTGGGTTFGSILTCPGGPGSVVGNAHIPPGGSTGQGGALSPTVSGGGQIITSAFGQQNNPSVTIAPGVGTNYVSIEKTLLGNYGAGGQGQFIGISQVQKIGLNGTNGYLIVWEYS